MARLLLAFRCRESRDWGACVNRAGSEFVGHRILMPDTALERDKTQATAEFTVFHQLLAGFAVLALVMLGIGGTIYKLM